MPRIASLKQNVRMQVANPTPITSPESAGRIAGEGMKSLGRSLEVAGQAVWDVWSKANEDREKLALNDFKRQASVDGASAHTVAQMETKDPLKQDKIKIFQEDFSRRAQERLKNMPEGNLRRQAEDYYKEAAATYQIKLLGEAPIDAANGIERQRKENFNADYGDIRNDIMNSQGRDYAQKRFNFLNKIKEKEALIDSMVGSTYSADQADQLKKSYREQASTMAINSFMNKGDFVSAKEAVGKSSWLAPDKIAQFDEEIDKRKYQRLTQANTLEANAESQADRALKKKNVARYALYHSQIRQLPASAVPSFLENIRLNSNLPGKMIDDLVDTAPLTRKDRRKVEKGQLSGTANDLYQKVFRGEDVTDDLIRAKRSGLDPKVADDILKAGQLIESLGTSKDGPDPQTFRRSGELLNSKTRGVFDDDTHAEMNVEHIRNIVNKEDPYDSVVKLHKKYAGKELQKKRLEATNGVILSIYDQPDMKSLQAMANDINRMSRSLGGMESVKLLQAYKNKMKLLSLTQGGSTDERRR